MLEPPIFCGDFGLPCDLPLTAAAALAGAGSTLMGFWTISGCAASAVTGLAPDLSGRGRPANNAKQRAQDRRPATFTEVSAGFGAKAHC